MDALMVLVALGLSLLLSALVLVRTAQKGFYDEDTCRGMRGVAFVLALAAIWVLCAAVATA